MTLTRDFKPSLIDHVERDPEFVKVMLDEAVNLFRNGEIDTARLMLRVSVNSTVGFEALLERLDDQALASLVHERRSEPNIRVTLYKL